MAIKDRLPSTEALLESLPLPRDFLTRLGVLAGQATRQLTLDSVGVNSASLNNVEISQVQLGSASIGGIRIENVDARLEQSSAFLQNVRSLLELHFTLEWEVDLGWIGHWGDTNDLGSIDIPVDLGNINIPDLDNIALDIPQVDIPAAMAAMQPINNLQLGTFSLSGMDVNKATLPAAGLTLTGMGVGEVGISSLSVPGATTQAIKLASAAPALDVVLPGATVHNLTIPQTSIPTITSGAFDTDATASAKSLTVNLGILKLTLKVTPTVHLDVGAMAISDAQLSASIGAVSVTDIHLPVSVQGLTASSLDAHGITVNKITF